jgi:hypothetical protein
VRKTAIETEKVPNNGSLSPVRVFQDEEARDILETTPPPEDAASAAAGPPGDDFDALFSRVRPNESGRNKQASGQGEGNAAPAPVIGLCDRGEGLKPSAVMVGDGGASWRLKALKRAQQRAADEGRRLDDEVQQRFESISALSSARFPCGLVALWAHSVCNPHRMMLSAELVSSVLYVCASHA